jgi:cytochrome c peroxidase
MFNPPSLHGLQHRRAYFHDARFKSLDDVLKSHPDGKIAGLPEVMSQLKAFLMTL